MTRKDSILTTAGRRKEHTFGVVNPPVVHASTILFDSMAQMDERSANMEAGLYYGRKGTTIHRAFEEAMVELEGGDGCWTFNSGMAAVTTAILSAVKAGDHILITDNAYEPTRTFANKHLAKFGVETSYFDPLCGAGIESLIRPNTTAIFLESPGSVTFEVSDVKAICKVARARGVTTILDNTWATPLHFNGFDAGCDIVVHAATKYIVGHSDAMLGTAAAVGDAWPRLRDTAYKLGQIAGPDDVYLGLRGMRTLAVRLRQHEESAMIVARWLRGRPEVHQILHPAFPECPGHETFKRDFRGSCGLFGVVLKGGTRGDMAPIVDNRKYFKIGFSWGGFESLILPQNPAAYRTATKWEKPGATLRLHVGLEDPQDLINDLEKGLQALNLSY